MASREMELAIAIGGYMNSKLSKSVREAKDALDSLGVSGSLTQKKLEALGKIESDHLTLEAKAKQYKITLDKQRECSPHTWG